MKHLTDEELVSAYTLTQQNDYFTLLYQRYYQKVYAHCLGYSAGISEQAEDLTHDIFERVLRHLTSYKGNARFSTWLFTVCRNYCLTQFSRDQKRGRASLAFEQNSETITHIDHVSMSEQQLQLLERAFDTLTDDDKRLLLARYAVGSSIDQLALTAQVSPSAMKMRLFRARARLREAFV